MPGYRNLGLLTKITVILVLTLLVFFGVANLLNYRQQRALITEEAVDKARLVASAAIRTREYLSNQLLRGGVALSEDRYGLIPVVASNRVGQLVGEDLDYAIRQISSRYRNPANAPDPFETLVLQRFYDDPRLTEYYAITSLEGEPVFRYLQPFKAEQSCLECHGEPARAPEFIKQLYPEGRDQAYHYRIGEVIGAASVTIPMARLQQEVLANMRNELLTSGGLLVALLTCLGLLVRVAVTGPLARLGEGIGRIVRTGRFDLSIPRRGEDEIGRLIDGFNDMVATLRDSTAQLEESERRFRVLTETARDGIISFLANGQIILFNRQAERMFGYSKREVLGESVARLVHEDCHQLHERGVEAYLRDEAPQLLSVLQRLAGRQRDGRRIDLELSLSEADSEGHRFYTAILREYQPD